MATAEHPAYTGVFGLTADPVHNGHAQVVINACRWADAAAVALQTCLLLPVYRPNLIAGKREPVAAYAHRLAMCQILADTLSARVHRQVRVCEVEKRLQQSTGKPNYSHDTLSALRETHGKLLFFVSSDHFSGAAPKFTLWHRWQNLLELSALLIHERPGAPVNQGFVQQLIESGADVHLVQHLPCVEVSSTQIRKMLKNNPQDVELNKLLPNEIRHYIDAQKLYR